ncbi:SDR family NAD(P)-dependent oxidoreductase [Neorhizobium sp. DT-125]|uniref:SDR family NAD(P)-dependent oxidoreductase n=1 Tax=Neorhizobium sp. DT-125 TaxID=3396163 RepID=UPI003F1E0F55
MDENLSLDTAIVTGGGGLLGRAICLELARTGYRRIAIIDLAEQAARGSAEAIRAEFASVDVLTITGNILEPGLPDDVIADIGRDGRRLSCIVNNAAANRPGSAATVTREDWDLMMSVNVAGPMFLCQAAIPHWREHGRGASVVNISSRAWLAGTGVAYSASKAGLIGLTHALAVELGPLGVRVNAVGPSWFDSPFNKQARNEEERLRIADVQARMSPLGRHVRPADIADAVAFLASPKSSFITGETIYVAGGGQLAVNASATRVF